MAVLMAAGAAIGSSAVLIPAVGAWRARADTAGSGGDARGAEGVEGRGNLPARFRHSAYLASAAENQRQETLALLCPPRHLPAWGRGLGDSASVLPGVTARPQSTPRKPTCSAGLRDIIDTNILL